MAESIVSPGVISSENNQSFIVAQPVQAGAAIIGPTVKGKVGIPTIVTTYSEYDNVYGSSFISGSQTYSYLTSLSAYSYFNNGGTSLLVTRVASGSFTPATASIQTSTALTSASATFSVSPFHPSGSFIVNGITIQITGSNLPANTPTIIYVTSGSTANSTTTAVATAINVSSSLSPYSSSLLNISSSTATSNLKLTYVGSNGLTGNGIYFTSGSTTTYLSGGTNTEAFVIESLSQGKIMNSDSTVFADGTLESGSADNLRYQIVGPDVATGTFTLLLRQGNDSTYSPSVVETWSNLSLDPLSSNYIEKIIGNQYENVASDDGEYYVDLIGNYKNASRYIRIKSVTTPTPQYLDNSDVPKPQFTGSIPAVNVGSFGGADGSNIPSTAGNYYENINNANTQGLQASAYTESISLLANKDAYRYNFITTPGLIADGANFPSHYSVISSLVSMVQTRGDSMTVIDLVAKGSNILSVTGNAIAIDNSYVATYWPWLQTIDPITGQQVWVPSSTLIPGVYAFNDSISAPWYAPAGTVRGILSNVITAERNLTQGNRDTLYQSNVNGIATLPATGVVVFGQKTLQKKKNALDRVNVRRLLIELKAYISQIANTLVFEQNTEATRNNFLAQVNPYLSSVQQRAGLDSFRVVMDTTNNTPTTIDNNQLIGQIYIQPTKTIEFIILEFNILPSGVTI
jgi:phage tail sheath protein FI